MSTDSDSESSEEETRDEIQEESPQSPSPASPASPVHALRLNEVLFGKDEQKERFAPKETTKSHSLTVFEKSQKKKKKKYREIDANSEGKRHYNANYIRTTKYTFLSFFPLNIYEQLKRVSNVYFLIVMSFTLLPGISPVSPVTTTTPVIFIFGVTLIKDLIEDIARYRADRKANGHPVSVYDFNKKMFTTKKTSQIVSGDIVRVEKDTVVPADLLILGSSKKEGMCFITTANLDGETNLKRKQAVYNSEQELDVQFSHGNVDNFRVICEENTETLSQFDCTFMTPHVKGEEESESEETQEEDRKESETRKLGLDYFICRGCVLKNTNFVIAMALFVGKQTKISQNLKKGKKRKWGNFDKKMNWTVFGLVVLQQIIVLGLTVSTSFVEKSVLLKTHWYLTGNQGQESIDNMNFGYYIGKWMTFFVLMSWMIPMSLFVTCEIVKSLQGKIMERNIQHVDEKTGEVIPMVAKTSILNQDLIDIDIIFSDKTGTLTENVMDFASCFVRGRYFGKSHYLLSYCEQDDEEEEEEDDDDDDDDLLMFVKCILFNNSVTRDDETSRDSVQKESEQEDSEDSEEEEEEGEEEEEEEEEEDTNSEEERDGEKKKKMMVDKVVYEGENSDEVCLVTHMAMHCGAVLIDRTQTYIEYELRHRPKPSVRKKEESESEESESESEESERIERKRVKILTTFAFTSERKRMSIVVEDEELDCVYVFSKGADSEMLKRSTHVEAMRKYEGVSGKEGIYEYLKHRKKYRGIKEAVYKYSKAGFRTLVMGYKKIGRGEFEEFLEKYERGILSSSLRSEEFVKSLIDEMEDGLTLLGVSAIEDELQDGVSETINYFKDAGLKVWVLTGDKTETAINICYSANIIEKGRIMEIYLTKEHFQNCQDHEGMKKLRIALNKIRKYFRESEQKQKKEIASQDSSLESIRKVKEKAVNEYALIIDSQVLDIILTYFQDHFVFLCQRCESVICCRCTPIQKSVIVELIQKKCKWKGVGVGDGANDVSMIQKAYIGIGIMGREGSQATRASDYALPKFKYLVHLLAIEGRYCYIRNSDLILISFYRNIMLSMMFLCFCFFNGFSATIWTNNWILSLYNFYHGLSPFIIGIFEKDINEKIILRNPSLYKSLKEGKPYFSNKRIVSWVMLSIFHSCTLFFGIYFIMIRHGGIMGYNLDSNGLYLVGHTVTSALMLVVYMIVGLETKNWNIITLVALIFSFLFYLISSLLLSTFRSNVLGQFNHFYIIPYYVLDDPSFYMIIIFLIAICVLPFFLAKFIEQQWFPRDWQKLLNVSKKRKIQLVDLNEIEIENILRDNTILANMQNEEIVLDFLKQQLIHGLTNIKLLHKSDSLYSEYGDVDLKSRKTGRNIVDLEELKDRVNTQLRVLRQLRLGLKVQIVDPAQNFVENLEDLITNQVEYVADYGKKKVLGENFDLLDYFGKRGIMNNLKKITPFFLRSVGGTKKPRDNRRRRRSSTRRIDIFGLLRNLESVSENVDSVKEMSEAVEDNNDLKKRSRKKGRRKKEKTTQRNTSLHSLEPARSRSPRWNKRRRKPKRYKQEEIIEIEIELETSDEEDQLDGSKSDDGSEEQQSSVDDDDDDDEDGEGDDEESSEETRGEGDEETEEEEYDDT